MALRRRVVCEAPGLEEIPPAAPPDFVGFLWLTRVPSGTGRRGIPAPVPLARLPVSRPGPVARLGESERDRYPDHLDICPGYKLPMPEAI